MSSHIAPLQGSLFGTTSPEFDKSAPFRRIQLDQYCWVDICSGWLLGADTLFSQMHETLPWDAFERPMYDRIVAVPRLSWWGQATARELPTVIRQGAHFMSQRYGHDFDRIGCNLYRDGQDSVAWHGDRIGRLAREPVIGVLTLGTARPWLLRPNSRGSTVRLFPASGDLIVMGGLCQTRWEHAVPKTSIVGPRLSVTFRYGPDDRVPGNATIRDRTVRRAPSVDEPKPR